MDIVVRAALAFLFIFILTRVIGRRELNSLEPFDLILLVMMGDLVQQGVTQNDFSVTGLLLAGGTVGAMTVLFSFLSYKVTRLRPLLDGEPVILVDHGRLVERNLRRERLTPAEIAAAARLQQIGSLDEVQWAVLETNGQISFIQKQNG
jgi:uncharacterized membrane protein YcaP (DUF421 family)